MSRAMSARTGKVRRPRKIPPIPMVSAMVWFSPKRAGISKSSTVASCMPTWITLIT